MKFDLTIACDSAAFSPRCDDADEPSRVQATKAELGDILATLSDRLHDDDNERSGFLRDTNGSRCGQWSLSDDAEALTRNEVHLAWNALNTEARRFDSLADEATAAPVTPGSPRIPAQTVEIWRAHAAELRTLGRKLARVHRAD